jgi:NTE family protein
VPVQARDRRHPTGTEALFAAPFIFERTIIREKLKSQQPDILQQAGTSHFQLFDLWRVKEILAAAETSKVRLKEKLMRILSAETLPASDAVAEIDATDELPIAIMAAPRRQIFKRLRSLRRHKDR